MTTLALILGFLVLGAIGFAARPSRTRTRSRGARVVGCLLIALPLPVAVALQLDAIALVAGAIAFSVGAFLVLPWPDDGGRRDPDPGSPPWWPEFDRDFRAYARRSPVGPRHVRGSGR